MERTTRTLTRAATAVAVTAAVLAVALAARGPVDTLTWLQTATGAVYLPVVLVGSDLARADRRNPVGWIFLLSGTSVPLSAAFGTAVTVTAARGGADPGVLALITSAFITWACFRSTRRCSAPCGPAPAVTFSRAPSPTRSFARSSSWPTASCGLLVPALRRDGVRTA